MPKERSIAKRLSGGEALDSLCHQVRAHLAPLARFRQAPADLDALMRGIWSRLARHEDFHSHRGYHGYSATVTVVFNGTSAGVDLDFRPAMSYGRPPLHDNFTVEKLAQGPYSTATVEIPVRPPNLVRQEADMPLPVQVEEQGQIVEKFIPAAKVKGKQKPGVKPPSRAAMDVPAIKGRLEMPEGVQVQQRG